MLAIHRSATNILIQYQVAEWPCSLIYDKPLFNEDQKVQFQEARLWYMELQYNSCICTGCGRKI